MLIPAPPKKPSSIHIPMVSLPSISIKTAPSLLPSAKHPPPLSKLSLSGNGRKKTHVTSLPKWIKKSTACKNSSSSITTKDNLPLLEKPESSSGSGKTPNADSNFTLPKSLPKRLSLKLSSFPTLLKPYPAQSKASSSSGTSVWSWKITLNLKNEEPSRQSTWWTIPTKLIKWKK